MLNALAQLKPYPITWSQLKQEAVKALDYGVHPTKHSAWKFGTELTDRKGWLGCTRKDTREWLRNGYRHEGLKVKTEQPYEISKKVRWNDFDGDPDLGRAVAGFDRYFFGQTKHEVKPALTVNFELYFSASFDPEMIADFGSWLAALFTALEQREYSLEINAVAGINRDKTAGRVELQVKKQGERADYTDWSALFSPAGYRVLMFGAIARACELAGVTANYGLGGTFSRSADVEYDKDARTLHITCGNRRFDRELMDRKLKETGLVA